MHIIADISLNFQTVNDILDIVEHVKADMIKLQWYSEQDLYGSGGSRTKLNIDWMPVIYETCKKHGKKLLCTVFEHNRVREINKWVYMHKVASSEITYKNLLNEIKLCRKPTILSTGGASLKQIKDAVQLLEPYCSSLLACDVEYPAKRHNIRNMLYLKNKFKDLNIGYSDHSIDICSMPILCQHYQASYYEKHVRPNKELPDYEPHALTVDEFNEMIDTLNGKDIEPRKNPHQRIYNDNTLRWVRPRV